jgi:phospholipase/carboxylesterase
MALDRVVVEVNGEDGTLAPNAPVVILLHGFLGMVDDLAPFARSLRVPGRFIVPHGIYDMAPLRGRAWWPIDVDERDAQIAKGPRDLSTFVPDGLAHARNVVSELIDELRRESPNAPLVLGGFSQGGMLCSDIVFRTDFPIAALALFSSARIAAGEWRAGYARRTEMPVFMSHGRSDHDLAFGAAELYKDELAREGLRIDWCPFDGGHEIPLVVLRAFKKFLARIHG